MRAFLFADREKAAGRAKAADELVAGGTQSPLAGVPVALKDNLCVEGDPCTCASKMLADFVPPYTATAVRRLLDAGAVPVGRTNMDEFAMGSSTENSVAGPTRNPWDLTRAPGGSSGGSAAAVAAGVVPVALGSDTGGSIRQPAAFCGVVGLKPTYGRVSRYGLVAFASSLDQIGPFARTVRGAAATLQVIAGHDPLDSTSLADPVPDYLTDLDEPLAGLRIGVVADHFDVGLDADVSAAVKQAIEVYESSAPRRCRSNCRTTNTASPPTTSSPRPRRAATSPGSTASTTATGRRTVSSLDELYEKSRGEGFGDEVKRRIMLGTYALSSGYYDAFYKQAMQVRRLIRRDYDAAFERCDVIAGPVTPTAAFAIGELADDPLAMYLSDAYTIGANLAGLPALSLPCGFTQGPADRDAPARQTPRRTDPAAGGADVRGGDRLAHAGPAVARPDGAVMPPGPTRLHARRSAASAERR